MPEENQQQQPSSQDFSVMQTQILALLNPLFSQLKQDFTSYVDQRFQALPQQDIEEPDGNEEQQSETIEGLRARLKAQEKAFAEFKKQRETEQAAEKNTRLDNAFLQLAQEHKIAAPQLFVDAMKSRLAASLVENDKAWFVKQGDSATSLADYVKSFVATDEGKALLLPSGTDGSGSRESQQTSQAQTQDVSTALWSAYSG